MPKLTEREKQEAKKMLRKALGRLVGESPKGLTFDDLNECWQDALASWFTLTKERV